MKKNILILLVALAFLGSACKDFLDVNEVNPNSASKVDAKFVLPAAINRVATTMNLPRRFDFVYLWHGLWSVSSGYSQPQNLVQYKLINSNYQNAFLELYTAANNFDMIEKKATDPKDAYFAATSKIMKAYIFQNLVDCWGDVPYSECFKAPANMKPKYDKQQDIYEALVLDLDAAIKLIQNAPENVNPLDNASDIMFSGDMDLWAKFANTLKLRMLVHQAGMTGRTGYITSAIATTASVGYLGAGESGLVNPGFTKSDTKMNPFYETFYNAAGTTQSDGVTYYTAGKDAIDFMLVANDPRIAKFYTSTTNPPAAPAFAGNVFGVNVADALSYSATSHLGYSKLDDGTEDPNTMIGTSTKSVPMLTDFESLFIQAEAVQRGFITGDAKALYESAVTQSFLYMGLTSGDAVNYLSQGIASVNFANAPDKIECIISQKWIALNGIAPVEIWTDFRRTGFPSNLHWSASAAFGPGTPPVRLLYPQNEITVNNDNLLAAQTAQGWVNEFETKLFWQNR